MPGQPQEWIEEKYPFGWCDLDPVIWASHTERVRDLVGEDPFQLGEPRSRFLAAPLSQEQRGLVDEGETNALAKESLALQSRVAQVEIKESSERLIDLKQVAQDQSIDWSFSSLGFHQACGAWAGKPRIYWVRHQFSERLVNMTERLQRIGATLHFEDAYRPMEVQRGLVERRLEWTANQHPEWSREQLLDEVRSKTATTPRLASHLGGAAVDVTLISAETREPLDFGHKYPEGGALVALDSPFVTQQQWQNRQLLFTASLLAGIAMYPGEDWHLSYGDNLACTIQGDSPASYGPVEFDDETGAVTRATLGPALDESWI